jgi:hypothetical protein
MAQQTNNLRERLLATLPQPENLAAYREETATLLAKHARALRWDRVTATTFVLIASALFFFSVVNLWNLRTLALHGFQVASALMFFWAAIFEVRYRIYESQVATLKETKQIQFQILELQASLRKEQ